MKINLFESFASLATCDGIIHFKSFQPLLNEISITQDENNTDSDNDDRFGVIKIAKFWNDHIDIDGHGDVYMAEWMSALNKLRDDTNKSVIVDQAQITKVFDFIDKDKNQLIDKTEFILFLTMKFKNEEVKDLQNELITIIKEQIEEVIDKDQPKGAELEFNKPQDKLLSQNFRYVPLKEYRI